jgi:hypothetical protein
MFKYNEWSDLIDSDELVMPIRKEGTKVYCLTKDDTEVWFDFDDFDFDKTPGERKQDVNIVIDDTPEEDHLVIINDVTIENKVTVVGAVLKVKTLKPSNGKEKDRFIDDALEKKIILDKAGYKYNKLKNVKVYIEQVDI